MMGNKNKCLTEDIDSVILMVGKEPSWYHENWQDKNPVIYTQQSRPKPSDAWFARGRLVQVIHGQGATDELFAVWLNEVINNKPEKVVAVDSAGEFFVC